MRIQDWSNVCHGYTSSVQCVSRHAALVRRMHFGIQRWSRTSSWIVTMVTDLTHTLVQSWWITRIGPMYVWWYRTAPMGVVVPIVRSNMVAPWIGETNSFFWTAPVSRLLERLTDVPLKMKKRNNVREIKVGLKWMFSLTSCVFIRWTSLVIQFMIRSWTRDQTNLIT
jgi:hypothetical protein